MSQRIRIIAGLYGGRLLEVPEVGTRPFADRVRQALFAILEPRLSGARVADLCAGSGAAGLEALSRGASHVLFVELSRGAVAVIRRNVASLDAAAQCEVRMADAPMVLRTLAEIGRLADLIIADPPYGDAALRAGILAAVVGPPSPLAVGGLLVLSGRHAKGRSAQEAPRGLRLVRALTYGETEIELYEHSAVKEER